MTENDQSRAPARRVTRTKTADVIPLGDDEYRLEARLTDLSRGGDYEAAGDGADRERESSVIHDIALTAHVRGPQLEVVVLDVRTLTLPYASCPFVLPRLQELIGQHLTAGWRRAVLELSGGTRGCTHVTTLLLGLPEMQPLVFFLKMNERVAYTPETRSNSEWIAAGLEIAPALADACYSLRRDGPVLAKAEGGQPRAE